MKNLRKVIIVCVLIVATICLFACDTQTPACTHVDADGNYICDKCGQQLPIPECKTHIDSNGDDICDVCHKNIASSNDDVSVDMFSINDLHGKFVDSDSQPGVDNLTTYFREQKEENPNTVLLSAGDMWQGGVETGLTRGSIVTEWMNELDFDAMALGNHEFDWGLDAIRAQNEIADFPFVAINVYDVETDTRLDFCSPSVMIEFDGVDIGIIGAIGDCYSSISSDKVEYIYFKTGNELSSLIRAESNRLRQVGADFVVLLWHEDYDYYDVSLSNGYIDLVFEGHSHQSYVERDNYGVYHLQGGGENRGISSAKIVFGSDAKAKTIVANTVSNYVYAEYEPDGIVNELIEKYRDQIGYPYEPIATLDRYFSSNTLCDIVAELYYEVGMEKWGEQYQIVLGGGYLSARSPYDLDEGSLTYAMLASIFPFDNEIHLCKVSGYSLKENFIFTTNRRYHIHFGDYGNSVKYDIDDNANYYIIVDSYTTQYKPNGLTFIAEYSPTVFARDLLADYFKENYPVMNLA